MPNKKVENDCINLGKLLHDCTGPWKPDMCNSMGDPTKCWAYDDGKDNQWRNSIDPDVAGVVEYAEQLDMEFKDRFPDKIKVDPIMPEDF